jgi:hypothetical protein
MADRSKTGLTGVKESYEAPTVDAVGTFEAVTKWASSGQGLDSPFGAGTPATSLTFSDPPKAG